MSYVFLSLKIEEKLPLMIAAIKTKTIVNANIFKYKIAQSASSSQRSPKTQMVNTNLPNDGYTKHTKIKNVKRIKIMSIVCPSCCNYTIKGKQ